MFNRSSLSIIKRFLHQSFARNGKVPTVRVANARLGRAIKRRSDFESQPRELANPSKYYEPFPFAVTEENKCEIMQTRTAPLHSVPYKEQLSSKESTCKNALRILGQDLYRNGTPIRLNVNRLMCHVNPIVPSTTLSNYRNRDEFSIWRGWDGSTKTVGYMAFPISKHGDTVCIEPNGSLISKEETIKIADILQEYIRHHTTLDVCYNLSESGGWRRFMISVNNLGDVMLIGIVSPRGITVQNFLDEKEKFKNYILTRSKEVGLNLKSLYFQACPHSKCAHKDFPYELLYGEESLIETINEFNFVISPETYYPNNSEGAALLYDTVRKTVQECFPCSERKPLIIDTNCGAGILSSHLASLASKVICVDSSPMAISDAKKSAELNNINNMEFLCVNLDVSLERILEKYSKYQDLDTMVVSHPPKSGLKPFVDQALRRSRQVSKIIYIAPKPEATGIMKNLTNLCSKLPGNAPPPFAPIMATPVDACPHVEACELVIALERLPEN